MKFITKKICKLGVVVIVILFILISAFLMLKYKNQSSTDRQILSRVDYRIFVCGEEFFLKVDEKDINNKRNGLFSRSETGKIIADGIVAKNDHIFLSSFFETIGSAIEYTTDHKSNLYLLTETGAQEFHTGDMCDGKKASLHLIHHRVETEKSPWEIYSRIIWKDKDHVLTNNYGKVPPGDCFIFIFDSEGALERPWPHCASHEEALARGELVMEK